MQRHDQTKYPQFNLYLFCYHLKLTFVAMKGNGSRGEIAIDNVLVTYGSNCVVVGELVIFILVNTNIQNRNEDV